VRVLTHCNAGWIATVDYGTALSAVYQAHDAGVPVQVWVDETRPRNQGLLTAWELAAHGVPHALVVDNAGGHLMQRGEVDLVLVGADRVSRGGDVCNKIGTYLKALAAFDCGVPFYAAVPSPTIDWDLRDALRDIPIEERSADEVRVVGGRDADGRPARVALAGEDTAVANPAFDVTPARLITAIVTERGIAPPARLADLFAPAGAVA
jgi:methylthioribose-1-phosphate isomerase